MGPGQYLVWYQGTSSKWFRPIVFRFRFGFCSCVPSSCGGNEQILQKTISALYSYCPFRGGIDISVSPFYKSHDRSVWLDRWVILFLIYQLCTISCSAFLLDDGKWRLPQLEWKWAWPLKGHMLLFLGEYRAEETLNYLHKPHKQLRAHRRVPVWGDRGHSVWLGDTCRESHSPGETRAPHPSFPPPKHSLLKLSL